MTHHSHGLPYDDPATCEICETNPPARGGTCAHCKDRIRRARAHARALSPEVKRAMAKRAARMLMANGYVRVRLLGEATRRQIAGARDAEDTRSTEESTV